MFDPFYLFVESIFLLCLLVFITLFFIPTKKKIYAGEVGKLDSQLVPIAIGLSGILLVLFIIFVFLVDFSESIMRIIFILFWVVFLLPATGFTLLSYLKAKSWTREYHEKHGVPIKGHVTHPDQPVGQPVHPQYTHTQGHSQQPGETMTVECPGCGSHLEISVGADTITCPYCGLSGTL